MGRTWWVLLSAAMIGAAVAQEPPNAPAGGATPAAAAPASPGAPGAPAAPGAAPAAPQAPAAGEAPDAPPVGERPAREGRPELDEASREILALIELPVVANEAREKGISKGSVKHALESAREAKIPAADASRILRATLRTDKNRVEKLGDMIEEKARDGVKGAELVAMIQENIEGKRKKDGDGPRGEGEGRPEGAGAAGGEGKGHEGAPGAGGEGKGHEGGAPGAGQQGAPGQGGGQQGAGAQGQGAAHEGAGKGEGKGEGKGKGGR